MSEILLWELESFAHLCSSLDVQGNQPLQSTLTNGLMETDV